MRRYDEQLSPARRYRFRPGSYAVLPLGRHVLLTHQAHPVPEFQLPGGGIDPGETPLGALHRECFEETGWRIARPRRLTAYRRFTFMPEYDLWAEKVAHIYVARPVRSHGPPAEPGHTAHWLPMSLALEALASEGDRQVLRSFMNGAFGRVKA